MRIDTRMMHSGGRFILIAPLLIFLVGCAESPHDVAGSGDVDKLNAMLEKDNELVHARNYMEKTPLHFAVTYSKDGTVEALLKANADPNAQDVTGMTPMHCAATLDRIPEA